MQMTRDFIHACQESYRTSITLITDHCSSLLFEESCSSLLDLSLSLILCVAQGEQFLTSTSFCFFNDHIFHFLPFFGRDTAPINFSSDLHTPLYQLSDSLPNRNLHSGEKHLWMTAECCGNAELRMKHCRCLPQTAHLSLLAAAFLPPLHKRPDQQQNTERCCF